MNNDALAQSYPSSHQSLLQIVYTTGERVNAQTALRKSLKK